MKPLIQLRSPYRTNPVRISPFSRAFPDLSFYARFLFIVYRASVKAERGLYDGSDWTRSSFDTLRALERVGVAFEITGVEHLKALRVPCVIIGNHMSVMETTVLPGIVQPVKPVTFVVKKSLLAYPFFRYVLKSRDPIAVTRTHPRRDFKTVLEEGMIRLRQGISIIVFPQTTRTRRFEPSQFNSIGIKLAQRAEVPVVPLALMTDAWENGRCFKDFGRIDPLKKVRFAFGEPLWVQGRGADEHRAVIRFIEEKLETWREARLKPTSS
ncbi:MULTISPECIES: lysophospholipid acyltransferase family protein [Desulfococcus]|uniref:Phospholipid/glycerol acyltransferase n=1 Tax=Desulfococcus multivorans DSM 2059 TaxID=1121405 RepID=S7U1B6_DESML|nr:lysophospholipid acyltransferase family protein [Desulfococcus multivorans]AQV02945.1 1-acyl-sn-glycerol-3-phosphate acyltransferase [Desulfococcus multivorans]EPR43226.1 phospholipid/glycerol acyltransferase [Desulfococcus multivorans DSM 2059]MDX9819917.1 lysophospholipid acyltransferase family protein [Desulfococcus multivorans]SJZ40573.1 1-acyl-sn-glycerol-3-phosphate acyltransferase [Desulfococcus multivorans DSM 2059]